MKKSLSLLLAAALCFTMTACGGKDTGKDTTQTSPVFQPSESSENTRLPEVPADLEPVDSVSEPDDAAAGGSGVLIAYFSYGENAPLADGVDASTSASIQYRNGTLTGNTGLVAGMIADATGGELFSILTAEQYPDNYDDTLDVGQAQKSDNARPELTSHLDSLENYDTVFLGFPNWWGGLPMAIYSFLDEYDLSGKTIVPFVTSGGSGFSNTIRSIEEAEPDAVVLEGLALSGSGSVQAEDDVSDWLARLGLAG